MRKVIIILIILGCVISISYFFTQNKTQNNNTISSNVEITEELIDTNSENISINYDISSKGQLKMEQQANTEKTEKPKVESIKPLKSNTVISKPATNNSNQSITPSPNTETTKHINNSKIVVFGDSITYGEGIINIADKWSSKLKIRFNLNLINSGVSGNTSSQGLNRIKSDVLDYKPDFVIINFAMNDHYMISNSTANVNINQFKANIDSIVKQVKSINAIPILVTPNAVIEGERGDGNMGGNANYYYKRHPASWYDSVGGANKQLEIYCNMIKQISANNKIPLIDMNAESKKYDLYEFLRSKNNSNFDDGVHPFTLGTQVYADIIGDFLEKNYK